MKDFSEELSRALVLDADELASFVRIVSRNSMNSEEVQMLLADVAKETGDPKELIVKALRERGIVPNSSAKADKGRSDSSIPVVADSDAQVVASHDLGKEVKASQELGRLYDAFSKEVFAFALRLLKNRSNAEDVTSDVFLELFRNLKHRNSMLATRSYLLRLTYNRCMTLVSEAKTSTDNYNDLIDPNDVDIEARLDLEYLLNRLPQSYLVTLILRSVFEMSDTETANLLNIPVGTVKSRYWRAMRMLLHSSESSAFQKEFTKRNVESVQTTRLFVSEMLEFDQSRILKIVERLKRAALKEANSQP